MIQIIDSIIRDTSHQFHKTLKKAVDVVFDSIRIFGVEALAISFNGGKDATVTLHLLQYVIHTKQISCSDAVRIIYFYDGKAFPEIQQFMEMTRVQYGLEYKVHNCGYKEGLRQEVDNGMRAVLMGVRYGDPYTDDAEHFTPSSHSWPSFMRVYPILHWTYQDGIINTDTHITFSLFTIH
jgi:FAD synthetase